MSTNTNYRADIDGLRAIAILTVLVFHYFSFLAPGGFIGVDVFFVISGYLITGLILANIRSQKWHLSVFWARRIRRIFPSLLAVFLVTSILAHFVLYRREAKDFTQSVIYGSLFWSNIFLHQHSGYFDAKSELRANLHLWSLAIEEQFYLFWPFVLAFIPERFLKRAVAIIFVASLVACFATSKQTDAFYFPWCRLWELASGGLLVLFAGGHTFSTKFKHVLSVIGLGLIFIAVYAFDRDSNFPGWRALLPVVGTSLIILAGPLAVTNRVLSARLFVYIGLISYPLYLWHWVLLYFVNVTENLEPALWEKLLAIAVSVVFSFLCYRFLEKPIRRGTRPWGAATWVLLACNFGFTIWFSLSGYLGTPPAPNEKITNPWSDIGQEFRHCPFDGDIKIAPEWCATGALNAQTVDSALIGDSHAHALYAGIIHGDLDPHRWILFGRSSCSPFLGVDESNPLCVRTNQAIVQFLKAHPNIKTVVVASAGRMVDKTFGRRLIGEKYVAQVGPELAAQGLINFISAIEGDGRKIIFLLAPPAITSSPDYCSPRPVSFRTQEPEHCTMTRAEYVETDQKYLSIIQKLKQKVPDIITIDPTDIFCDDNLCPVTKNGRTNYSYSDHVSADSAVLIFKKIAEKL